MKKIDFAVKQEEYLVLLTQNQMTTSMASKRTSRLARAIRTRDRLLAQLPDLRKVLRGSLVTRYRRCGKATCCCSQEGHPGHGPAYYLMVTVAPGNTLQIVIVYRV